MGWLTNDMIFYGGIIISAIALLVALISIFIFTIKKMNLSARLDTEYGKQIKRTETEKGTMTDK